MPPRSSLRSSAAPSSGAQVVALPRPARLDDVELVRGLIERRPAAVAELYDRFVPAVRGMLVRTLGSTLDVDDLVQETFVTVVGKVRELRDPTAVRSFVVSIAVRLARNELRKRRIRRWVGLDEIVEPPLVPGHDPHVAELVRRVYGALDRLDADVRLAFVLRHVEGYELTETAAACGCSLATIKRRLSRAQQRFEALAASDPALSELLARGAAGEGAA